MSEGGVGFSNFVGYLFGAVSCFVGIGDGDRVGVAFPSIHKATEFFVV